jgi:hypothetical protein
MMLYLHTYQWHIDAVLRLCILYIEAVVPYLENSYLNCLYIVRCKILKLYLHIFRDVILKLCLCLVRSAIL